MGTYGKGKCVFSPKKFTLFARSSWYRGIWRIFSEAREGNAFSETTREGSTFVNYLRGVGEIYPFLNYLGG